MLGLSGACAGRSSGLAFGSGFVELGRGALPAGLQLGVAPTARRSLGWDRAAAGIGMDAGAYRLQLGLGLRAAGAGLGRSVSGSEELGLGPGSRAGASRLEEL